MKQNRTNRMGKNTLNACNKCLCPQVRPHLLCVFVAYIMILTQSHHCVHCTKRHFQNPCKRNLGRNGERFTRKVHLKSVLRLDFEHKFTIKVEQLCDFIRNVLVRVQVFINTYIVTHQVI